MHFKAISMHLLILFDMFYVTTFKAEATDLYRGWCCFGV